MGKIDLRKIKLGFKPCPFCGFEALEFGYVENPDAFWDDAMRGEEYYYVKCAPCGLIMKAERIAELQECWNGRVEE